MSRLPEPVLLMGTGLIGTSVALALRRGGADVLLSDADPAAVEVAVARGAGRPGPADLGHASLVGSADRAEPHTPPTTWTEQPGLVVVAVPPTATAGAVAEALRRFPSAFVTDVTSVKQPVLRALHGAGIAADRYVGGHPMAGREVSGPGAASAELFADRPWVLAPHVQSDPAAVQAATSLALAVRALPVVMDPAEHDRAVAVVSHVPQVISSLLAARLLDVPEDSARIAGQGLRDMTRIAASDPALWVDILTANARPVTDVLTSLRDDLDHLVRSLRSADLGSEEQLAQALSRGNAGFERIPGKHGAGSTGPTSIVPVAVPDRPGSLGRLFAAVADAGCQIEDIRIEHALGRPTGVVQMTVAVAAAGPLSAALSAAGWDVRA